MDENNTRKQVAHLIDTKLLAKQEVFENTKKVFQMLKTVLLDVQKDLQKRIASNSSIAIEVVEVGKYEVRLIVGGDTVVFLMHSNVFDFASSHIIHKNSYAKSEPYNTLCGQIYMYNFLSDSFKYQRSNDLGYLMARLLVNKESHFYVEGRERLSFLLNDFQNAVLNPSELEKVIDEVLKQCLEFDLYSPPYNQVEIITVEEVNQVSNELKMQTGKRLGFKFKSESNPS